MTGFQVSDLKIPVREGYVRGQDGLEQILRAALTILIEHGSKALTLRRIAAECGLKAGNLAYYFRSKEDLLRELLNAIIGSYEDAFDAIFHEASTTPEDRLSQILILVLEDITTKKSTRVFPELWAMSNHDPFVQDRVEELYRRARVVLENLIAQIRPDLPVEERATLALFMSASMEGMTIFAGFGKPYRAAMGSIQQLTIRSFLFLVRDIKPGEISRIQPEDAQAQTAVLEPQRCKAVAAN